MSFIKAIFWDSKVKWSLASFKAQPGPGSSLPFSFVAPATLPTSSLTSSSSLRFPGARVRPQVSQAHTRQGPKQVQGPGPCCAPHRAGHDRLARDAARAPGTQTHVVSGAALRPRPRPRRAAGAQRRRPRGTPGAGLHPGGGGYARLSPPS